MLYESIPDFLDHVSTKYRHNLAFYIRRFLRTTKFTYEEVNIYSQKIGNFLLNNKLKQGDAVLIWAPNMPEWSLTFLGCLSAGIVVVPVGLHSTAEVVEKYIDQTNPKILFLSKFYPLEFKKHKDIKVIYLEEIVDLVKDTELKKIPDISKNSLAEIVFTSGTTGEPKGVMISHHNILFQIEQLFKVVPKYKHYRLLSVLPLSHVMEQIVGLFGPMSRGGTIYSIPRINAVTIRKALKKYRITDLGVVPQLLRMFLDTLEYQIAREKKDGDFKFMLSLAKYLPLNLRRLLFKPIHDGFGGKLYVFGVGSAPLDVKLAQTWEAMGIKVVEGYGASETTGGVTANRVENRKLGSVGKKLTGMEVKISTEGEIIVKGDNVTKGYFNNEGKTKEAFTEDGYFRTGDVGYFDKDGWLYITGREKFKIVTAAGDKIYPEDIERKLNAHPDVWDSCVMGIKKGDGEIVYAAVIIKTKASLQKVIGEVNKKLEANQQILDSSLWAEKDFPRLHTLKIDRNQVKEIIEKQMAGEKVALTPATENQDKLKEILAKVCKVSPDKIKETTNLVTDLDLDSLKRVELASLIEEEYSAQVDEAVINQETTVSDLRLLINSGKAEKPMYDLEKIVNFIRTPLAQKLKVILQDAVLFLMFNTFTKLKLVADVDMNKITPPVVFIGNHPGPNDIFCFLKAVPKRLREKIVTPATHINWINRSLIIIHDGDPITWILGGIPLNKAGGEVGNSLDALVDFLDDGYAVILLPEGRFTRPGNTLESMRNGLGLILAGTKIPIIPYYVSGNLSKTYPYFVDKTLAGGGHLENFIIPRGFSRVTVKIGKPFTVEQCTPEEATKVMQDQILEQSRI